MKAEDIFQKYIEKLNVLNTDFFENLIELQSKNIIYKCYLDDFDLNYSNKVYNIKHLFRLRKLNNYDRRFNFDSDYSIKNQLIANEESVEIILFLEINKQKYKIKIKPEIKIISHNINHLKMQSWTKKK